MAKIDLTGEAHLRRLRMLGVPVDNFGEGAANEFENMTIAEVAGLVAAGQLAGINEKLEALPDIAKYTSELTAIRRTAETAAKSAEQIGGVAEKFGGTITGNRNGSWLGTKNIRGDKPS
jgi:hypothetical protein